MERRRARRFDVIGARAVADPQGVAVGCEIRDVSSLGLGVRSEDPLDVGDELEWALVGGLSGRFRGRVVRCARVGSLYDVGVQLLAWSPGAAEAVSGLLGREARRSREAVVMVATADLEAALDLWEDLDEIGVDARVVMDLDEVAPAIRDDDLLASLLLVDARADRDYAEEVVRLAVVRFPSLPVSVLLADDAAEPSGLASPRVTYHRAAEWASQYRSQVVALAATVRDPEVH